ncbi:MAG: hypothetical protein RPS47_13845 [Colwellia sp.]|jgi:hypothetical protein
MEVTQRNDEAKRFISTKLDQASKLTETDFEDLQDYYKLLTTLENLIQVNAKGFRGVVATAITGKYLDPNYDPLNDFYSCNPRSIFEQGIFYALEGRVPCGKSDPLNVAKNIYVLDEAWARGKRPQSAAQAAVDYLRFIESSAGDHQQKIIDFYFFKLHEYGKSIQNIVIQAPEEAGLSHQLFAWKLSSFVLDYPESGTIPQLVISILLNKVYEHSSIKVEGGDESVFGTNTTSKKPADIWLENEQGPFNLYEITVKKIDYKRLDDCIQSLDSVDMLGKPVHFICRLNKDIATLDTMNLSLTYKSKTFNFVDISVFIRSLATLLTSEQIITITNELAAFVGDIQRPIKTKEGWNHLFG